MRMYKTLEECADYCSDNMEEFVNDILEYRDDYADDYGYSTEDGQELYGCMLAWISGKYTSELQSELRDSCTVYAPYILTPYTDFDKVDVEDKNLINSIMHILHSEIPDLRESAIEWLNTNDIIREETEAYPKYDGCVLTGKDAVPKEWADEIREKVSDLDVSLDIRMTWLFSHMDIGSDYTYDIPESIYVEIHGVNEEDVEEAKNRIDKMEFHADEKDTDPVEKEELTEYDSENNDIEDDYDYDPID